MFNREIERNAFCCSLWAKSERQTNLCVISEPQNQVVLCKARFLNYWQWMEDKIPNPADVDEVLALVLTCFPYEQNYIKSTMFD